MSGSLKSSIIGTLPSWVTAICALVTIHYLTGLERKLDAHTEALNRHDTQLAREEEQRKAMTVQLQDISRQIREVTRRN